MNSKINRKILISLLEDSDYMVRILAFERLLVINDLY
jgi:hypothetical protein